MDCGGDEKVMTGSWCEFRSVSKVYDGRAALSAVSFTIAAEEHTAILGPSGCGKSTIFRLLAGLDAPSAGQVLLDGGVVSEPRKILRPPHLRGVAMVFQDLALWPNLSVMDNVLLGLSGAGLTRQEARTRASEALALCAIESLAKRKPGTISGGEQQRAALARAIAGRPSYLLLDEPFSGLDLITKAKLLEEITALAAKRRVTLLLVTHDPLEATTLCRSAIVLNNGCIEETGILADLLHTSHSQMLKIFRTYRGERLAST
jgi:ABC-type Fe3+/spermidine/putrescine transport system ATPase subunit